MAQSTVNFRMDEELKKGMEKTCKDIGMSMTTAFTIFATKVNREKRIPFDLTAEADPFFSETNMNRIRRAKANLDAGKGLERELIEVSGE